METEKVFDELRKIVAETERIFTVYKHTDPEGKVYIGYCCGSWKKLEKAVEKRERISHKQALSRSDSTLRAG